LVVVPHSVSRFLVVTHGKGGESIRLECGRFFRGEQGLIREIFWSFEGGERPEIPDAV
jgi:hypothetical protein